MERSIEQLDDPARSAWPVIEQLLAQAENGITAIPAEAAAGARALLALQVTTASVLGAITRSCEGLLVGGGWLRVLGAGGERMRAGVREWNAGPACAVAAPLDGAMIVGHDAAGGFFALDGGLFEREPGTILWRSPVSLEWEDLGTGYPGFIEWCAFGDLAHFYEDLRWPGWEEAARGLACDDMLISSPVSWENGPPLPQRARRATRASEVWAATRPS